MTYKPPAAVPKPAPAEAPPPGGTGLTLDDVLGQTAEATQRREQAAGDQPDWNALIQQTVGPHIRSLPATNPQQAMFVAGVDIAATALLRAILHAPEFQALEGAWRGVDFLTRRLETDRQLTIHLLDVSKAELTADLTAGDDLSRTNLYKLLVEQTVNTPGGEPWAVVLGSYTFDPTWDDIEMLGRLAKVVRQGGSAFLAGASPRFVGCDSFGAHPDPDDWQQPTDANVRAAWDALRQLPEAASVGLALPRFLLRRPYGKRGDPSEQLDFEELGKTPVHEGYLWGNPAFAAVCLLGEAFSRSGWDLRPGEVYEIDGLPGHVYDDDGETAMKPCAEAVLTERAVEAITDAGLMPLLSIRGSDTVRLASFRPLARAANKLAGRWR
jgi:type VI secretion system protein ImpC